MPFQGLKTTYQGREVVKQRVVGCLEQLHPSWLERRAIQEMLADARQGMDTPHLIGAMVSQDLAGSD